MSKRVLIILAILSALLVLGLLVFSKNLKVEVSKEKGEESMSNSKIPEEAKPSPRPKLEKKLSLPKMQIDKVKKYTAVLKTSEGEIKIELYADRTPITVNNFVYLAREKFYDDTVFHRIIKGFMIQGGDPNGDGTGGPGYKFDDESFNGEYNRGTVAMANSGPNTNGSQFFIMHQDYNLPKNYVIFGKVTSGMKAVDKIAEAMVKPNLAGENSTPVNPIVIKSAEIIEE